MFAIHDFYFQFQSSAFIYKLIFTEDMSKERETPPEFIVQMRDLAIHIGEPATFDCQITGHPRPEIYWTRVRDRNDGMIRVL